MGNNSNRSYYGKMLKQGLVWKIIQTGFSVGNGSNRGLCGKKLTLGTCGKTPRKRAAIAEMDMLMHGNMACMHVDACENAGS